MHTIQNFKITSKLKKKKNEEEEVEEEEEMEKEKEEEEKGTFMLTLSLPLSAMPAFFPDLRCQEKNSSATSANGCLKNTIVSAHVYQHGT